MKRPSITTGRGTASRVVVVLATLGLLTGMVVIVQSHVFGRDAAMRTHANTSSPTGSAAEFRYLSAQSTNYCSLDSNGVMSMGPGMMLQGACCNPLNQAAYQYQVNSLKHFRSAVIPTNPYSIQAALARKLIGYDHSIGLSAVQQTTYTQAIAKTVNQAPCCCHCWRWPMTSGMAKDLIVRLGWMAIQVAEVVDLVNGCGGPYQHGSYTPTT